MTEKKDKEQTQPVYTGMNIFQRLHAIMTEVSYVQKTKPPKEGGLKYSSVKHDDVTAKVREPMLKWGVYSYPCGMNQSREGNMTEMQIMYRFVCIDKPDDFLDIPSLGYGADNQDKGAGKAMSYAVKYALLKGLGLETGDDPDNESVEREKVHPLAGSVRDGVDTEQRDQMYDQGLKSLDAAPDLEKLKSEWGKIAKGRKVFTEEQWKDLEAKKDERKFEIENKPPF
jgi:hypothetical protein